MSSNKKRFSLGWVLGVSLGLASSAVVVYAGNIATTYGTGDPLTATMMTEIRTAVNDNDTRVDGIQTGVPVCLAGMTRVGPTCVDTLRQAAAGTTWSAAVDTCRTAGKRLLTPGEYVAARNLGTITDMTVYEWVDVTAHGLTPNFTMYVGAVGPGSDQAEIESFVNFTYDNRTLDDISNIYFRCAR